MKTGFTYICEWTDKKDDWELMDTTGFLFIDMKPVGPDVDH